MLGSSGATGTDWKLPLTLLGDRRGENKARRAKCQESEEQAGGRLRVSVVGKPPYVFFS